MTVVPQGKRSTQILRVAQDDSGWMRALSHVSKGARRGAPGFSWLKPRFPLRLCVSVVNWVLAVVG